MSVVALELLFGEHVVRNDVISFSELVPLGYKYEDYEEHDCRQATHNVKYPLDTNVVIKDSIKYTKDATHRHDNSGN